MRYRLAKAVAELTDSPGNTVVASFLVGACAGALEYFAHHLAMRIGISDTVHTFFDAGIIGIAATLLIWFLFSATRERRQRVLENMRVIAELNHEIRNALQVIVYSHHDADAEHSAVVMNSVQRIDRTLKELFPVIGERQDDRTLPIAGRSANVSADERRRAE